MLKAFFDPDALGAWWQVAQSVTTPRVLGPYAIEWRPTDYRDEVLGRLGGVFRGTVMQFDARPGSSSPTRSGCRPTAIRLGRWRSRYADADRPDDDADVATTVHVMQTGFEESAAGAATTRSSASAGSAP